MKANEIIKEISRLPINRRILIVEQTLKSIREVEEKDILQKAVDILLHDYSTDKELTVFTGIDFDKFYKSL